MMWNYLFNHILNNKFNLKEIELFNAVLLSHDFIFVKNTVSITNPTTKTRNYRCTKCSSKLNFCIEDIKTNHYIDSCFLTYKPLEYKEIILRYIVKDIDYIRSYNLYYNKYKENCRNTIAFNCAENYFDSIKTCNQIIMQKACE